MIMDYIFDIDGTISNCTHRLKFLQTRPKDFESFDAAMGKDSPDDIVVNLMRSLWDANNAIIICTGRNERFRDVTMQWLDKHEIKFHSLYMRPRTMPYEQDAFVKEFLLGQMRIAGYNPVAAFEDRKRCKRMYVKNNILVFDLNQTDKEF